MIFDGQKTNLAEVARRNQAINEHRATDSRVPSCAHDFWDAFRKAEFGDIVLCNRCHCYYAKIKNLPWVTIHKKWMSNEIMSYGTNHLGDGYVFSDGAWAINVPARVTD
jgi:hypothetical protein